MRGSTAGNSENQSKFRLFFSFLLKKKQPFFDAAAKNDAGGDEKLIICFTWPNVRYQVNG